MVGSHSPPDVRAALRFHSTTIGTGYQKLRTFVNDFLTNGFEYNSAGVLSGNAVASANSVSVPMDVRALSSRKGKQAGDK